MKMVKVLMVGLLPINLDLVKGGVVAVILNLFSGFSKMANIEIIHVSFNDDIKSSEVKQFSSNIKIYYLPFKVKITLLDYLINRKAFRDILTSEKPDLIHIQEITPHLLRFISFPKARIVVTQHGVMREEIKTAVGLQSKLKCLFKGFVEEYIFPRFQNIIFISQYNRNLFPSKKINYATIFNPVNPIFYTDQNFGSALNSLLYVGVINQNKNLIIILKALVRLREANIIYKLSVVGGYKAPEYQNEILRFVQENGLTMQVAFHGWQTQEQILKLYEKSNIFILPSLQETMPVSIEEAMAQEKVVVASNVGAISEMFTDKISGFLFEKNNLDELCEVLKLLYNNHSLIEFVSVNARREAEDKFHPDKIALKTLDFYHQVINESQLK